MRITGLDSLVVMLVGLAIAVMVPMPWLLTATWEGGGRAPVHHCTPAPTEARNTLSIEPTSLTALWLTTASAAALKECHPPAPEGPGFGVRSYPERRR